MKKNIDSKKLASAVIIVVLFGVFVYIGIHFSLTKYLLILYGIIAFGGIFALWTRVGHLIFNALVKSTIVFSILIFITQQYCDLPISKQTANQSLILLYSTGLLYTMGLFFLSLKDQLFGTIDEGGELKKLEVKYKGWKYYALIMLYLTMIAFYIYLIVNVTGPILKELCVYSLK